MEPPLVCAVARLGDRPECEESGDANQEVERVKHVMSPWPKRNRRVAIKKSLAVREDRGSDCRRAETPENRECRARCRIRSVRERLRTPHVAPHKTDCRLRRVSVRRGRTRRLEHLAARADGRSLAPHSGRELRISRRRAGHEGESRAAGLGGLVRASRSRGPGRPVSSRNIAGASTRRSKRPLTTSPRSARRRSSPRSEATVTKDHKRFDGFLRDLASSSHEAAAYRYDFSRLEPQFDQVEPIVIGCCG